MAILICIIILLALIQIYRRFVSNTRIILIEGLDCSGKKTLAKQICKHSNESNIDINIGSLLKSPLSKISDQFTYNWRLPNLFRTLIYSLSYIIDGFFYIPKRNRVILQISYLPRHKAYNQVNKLYILNFIHKMLSPFYIKFERVVYLHAEYDIRIERHINQFKFEKEIQTIEKRFHTKNKVMYFEWEKQVQKYLKEFSNYVVSLDTSHLNKEELWNKLILSGFKL